MIYKRFAPDRLSAFGCWFDISNPNGDGSILANNSNIISVYDKTFRRVNAAQTNGGNQPINYTNQLNGLPAMGLNAASTYLQVPYNAIFSNINTTGLTAFFVGDTNTVGAGFSSMFGIQSGNNGWKFGRKADALVFTTLGTYDYVSPSSDFVVNTPAIYSVTFSSAFTVTFAKNGFIYAPINYTSGAIATTGNLTIGTGGASNSEWWGGRFMEGGFFYSTKNSTNIVSIHKYLGAKWGISV